MVHLYGVVHGVTLQGILQPFQEPEQEVYHTHELMADLLRKLPKGKRVGLELMSDEDWQNVYDHLILTFENAGITESPCYGKDRRYWKTLADICKKAGLEVAFLEDTKLWFKYNTLFLELVKNQVEKRSQTEKQEGESRRDFLKRRIWSRSDIYNIEIMRREVMEIDRDSAMLEAIKSQRVDAAIVGLAHSDFWIATPSIAQRYGLNFESYSTEDFETEWGDNLNQRFTADAKPNPKMVFERESLERALRLIKQERIVTSKNPDFVGTWNLNNPYEGYFELFVSRNNNGNVSGTIEDCLGTGDFNGVMTDTEFRFLKNYRPDACIKKVDKYDLHYNGTKKGIEVFGEFSIGGGSGDFFYMIQSSQEKPVELAFLGFDAIRDSKMGQGRLF